MLSTDVNNNVNVSLPRVWVQEIKHTPMMYITHGLFLTCTQKYCFIYKSCIKIFTKCTAFLVRTNPLYQQLHNPAYLLGEPASLLVVTHPIHPCLWSANNCPTLWLLPLSPFHIPQFKLHYLHRRHQQSWSSSSGTVNVITVTVAILMISSGRTV
jgi:hypothetical protein